MLKKIILLILIFLPVIGYCQIPNDTANLLALWHFDAGTGSTFADSSVNGNNGGILNMTWVTGKWGNGLNGADHNSASTTTTAGYGISDASQFSISLWVYFNTTHDNTLADNGGTRNITIFADKNNNKIKFQTWWVTTGFVASEPAFTWAASKWYHICCTAKKADFLHIYINGVEIGSPVVTPNQNLNPATGKYILNDPGLGSGANAIYDDYAIFSVALSSAQVMQINSNTWATPEIFNNDDTAEFE